jgi:hypothetical protein
MKKTTMLLCLILFGISLTSYSQPWFGQLSYPTDSTSLTSAIHTLGNPGYAMLTFRPIRQTQAANTSPDFTIIKTDQAGGFSAGTDFMNYYQITDDNTCGNGQPVKIYNCRGGSIIETSDQGGGETYAIAVAYDLGVIFATLDNQGNVIQTMSWNFHTTGNVSKPAIRESITDAGVYYICGTAPFTSGGSYVLKVTYATVQAWGVIIAASHIEARDLMESPYNSDELIVVGRVDVPGSAADCMFMSMNSTIGTVNYINSYNFDNYDSDDWFSSIELAASPTGGSGYILGGRCFGPIVPACTPPCYRKSNHHYTQLMAKIDANGNVVWSSLILPKSNHSTNVAGGEITRVFERFNANSSSYEYYGVAVHDIMPTVSGPIGRENLVVYKLDNSGVASFNPDEFHYSSSLGSTWSHPCRLAELRGIDAGGNNDGIQVFGRDVNLNIWFGKAYFNGETGCTNTLQNIDSIAVGVSLSGSPSATLTNYPYCNYASLNMTAITVSESAGCYASSVSGGSNARPLFVSNHTSSTNKVFPNPACEKIVVELPERTSGAEVFIFNSTGQLITYKIFKPEEEITFDLRQLRLSPGIYTIKYQGTGLSGATQFIIANNL